MKAYVTGRSGTGKSSVARAFAAKGVAVVDIDNGLCHWENKHTGEQVDWTPGSSKEWHDAHEWICDAKKLEALLSENANIVVVGAATNQEEYFHLFDKVFILCVESKTIISRIHQRTDNQFGKDATEQERILFNYGEWENRMIKNGAVRINAEKSLDEVVAEIGAYF